MQTDYAVIFGAILGGVDASFLIIAVHCLKFPISDDLACMISMFGNWISVIYMYTLCGVYSYWINIQFCTWFNIAFLSQLAYVSVLYFIYFKCFRRNSATSCFLNRRPDYNPADCDPDIEAETLV